MDPAKSAIRLFADPKHCPTEALFLAPLAFLQTQIQIQKYSTRSCHTPTSQGPCKTGEWFVMARDSSGVYAYKQIHT